MSEWKPEVIPIKLEKHPDADNLSIVANNGYPIVVNTKDWEGKTKGVYIPIDTIVPNTPEFEFLGKDKLVKARKFRGFFSMGLLIPAKDKWEIGYDPTKELQLTKYDEDNETNENVIKGPKNSPPKYDIFGYRGYKNLFLDNEEVIITEKINGYSSRFLFVNNNLWVGSRTNWKKESNDCLEWKIAHKYNLKEKLSSYKDLCFYGEIYGHVKKGFDYGTLQNVSKIVFFDIWKFNVLEKKQWLNWEEFKLIMHEIDLPIVPVLYEGPWSDNLISLADGPSTIKGANNIREGIVIKPVEERYTHSIGRVFLKLHGENFLLKKYGK